MVRPSHMSSISACGSTLFVSHASSASQLFCRTKVWRVSRPINHVNVSVSEKRSCLFRSIGWFIIMSQTPTIRDREHDWFQTSTLPGRIDRVESRFLWTVTQPLEHNIHTWCLARLGSSTQLNNRRLQCTVELHVHTNTTKTRCKD